MSFTETWGRPRELSGVFSVTKVVKFGLQFPHFDEQKKVHQFATGLHVIYGEAGVGKSSLARLLSGMEITGPLHFEFSDYRLSEQVFFIPQNPENQFVTSSVREELAFSLECLPGNQSELQQRFDRLNSLLPKSIDRNLHPDDLSGGEQEMLNLVLAMTEPRNLLIVDDGFSFLNDDIKAKWVKQIEDYAEKADCVVLWFTSEWSDLNFGNSHWEMSLSGMREIDEIFERLYPDIKPEPGSLSLKFSDLNFGYGKNESLFSNFNYSGESISHLGITGPNGSGKTTLALMIMDILKPVSGSIKLGLDSYCKPCYLDQFPERMLGVGTVDSWVRELMEANLLSAANMDLIKNVLTQLQISWDQAKDKSALDLSWSTLRMMMIVILSYADFNPVILDEPTFGLGWHQRVNLQRFLLRKMRSKHTIIISHDKPFIEATCDQILTLNVPEYRISEHLKENVQTRKN